MTYAVLTRAATSVEASNAVLTGASLTAGLRQSAILTRARIVDSLTVLSVDAGPALISDPFELITLAAAVTGSPDTVVWTLQSATNSAAPVLIGTGASVSYYMPPTVNGTVLTWLVTATKAGNVPVTDTVVHQGRNHAGPWFIVGPNYITGPGRRGVKISTLPD